MNTNGRNYEDETRRAAEDAARRLLMCVKNIHGQYSLKASIAVLKEVWAAMRDTPGYDKREFKR